MTASDLTQHDQFVVTRRRRMTVTPSLSRVDVYDFALAASDDPICRVRQRVWRFNQDIRFHGAAGGDVMRIRARPRFDPWARYELTDERRETIGEIQKVFGRDPLRSAYLLYDDNGDEIARVDGRAPTAPIRRRAGRVAVAGVTAVAGLAGLTLLGPTGLAGVASLGVATGAREFRGRLDPVDSVPVFDITRDGEPLGSLRRRPRSPELGDMLATTLLGPGWTTTVFDVDMSMDRDRTVDRRLILALLVALDALRGLVPESPLR
jgi:hypothetical protein